MIRLRVLLEVADDVGHLFGAVLDGRLVGHQPVVDVDHDHVPAPGNAVALGVQRVRVPGDERAAVDVEHHRQAFRAFRDVQIDLHRVFAVPGNEEPPAQPLLVRLGHLRLIFCELPAGIGQKPGKGRRQHHKAQKRDPDDLHRFFHRNTPCVFAETSVSRGKGCVKCIGQNETVSKAACSTGRQTPNTSFGSPHHIV